MKSLEIELQSIAPTSLSQMLSSIGVGMNLLRPSIRWEAMGPGNCGEPDRVGLGGIIAIIGCLRQR